MTHESSSDRASRCVDRRLPREAQLAQKIFTIGKLKRDDTFAGKVLRSVRGRLMGYGGLVWRYLPRVSPSGNHIEALMLVLDRTLGWDKLIEIVPFSHMCRGVRGNDRRLLTNEQRLPIFAGTGRDEKTLRKALDWWVERGVLTRFPAPNPRSGQSPYAYMPLTPDGWLELLRVFSEDGCRYDERELNGVTCADSVTAVNLLKRCPGIEQGTRPNQDFDVVGILAGRVHFS